MLAAPATGSEFNTLTAGLIPVACWRVDDIRFAFDSSVVTPGTKTELVQLKALRAAHPGSPLSIFGHADPVGNDDYNKTLSGRRAIAIFGLLTRDTELWDELYRQPAGNDKWGTPALQMMLDEVNGPSSGAGGTGSSSADQAAEADKNPAKRKQLFRDYMDKLCGPGLALGKEDFLARGVDAKGKGDYQGCSEFNPVLIFSQRDQQRFEQAKDKSERNTANAPNRRVMALLFRKGTKVDPTRWPCPRALEGAAACRKRFWSDGESRRTRRLPDAERRFEQTADTFACRFYHRLTTGSPCEDVPPPGTATLEFVLDGNDDHKADESAPVTTFARMGLWDHAFDPPAAGSPANTPNVLANDGAEDKNFVGADSRRFYIRVTDPNANVRVKVDWRTLKEDGTDLDRPGDQSLTLLETNTDSGVFTSHALMLVSDADDQKQETDSGLPGGDADVGKRKQGQSNHRIRRASLRGFVEAEYVPRLGPKVVAKIPVFNRSPDERRTIPLHIFVLRRVAGGQGVVPTAPGSQVWARDVRIFREAYERLGISMRTEVPPGTAPANIVRDGTDALVLLDPPAGVNAFTVDTPAERLIGTASPGNADTIRLYYVGRLTTGNRGEAFPDIDFTGQPQQAAAFINASNTASGPYSPAHEAGHILVDKSVSVNGAHFNAPTAPPGNKLLNDQNLMRNATSSSEGVGESKRLWDGNDQDGINQFTRVRASHYTRNFS